MITHKDYSKTDIGTKVIVTCPGATKYENCKGHVMYKSGLEPKSNAFMVCLRMQNNDKVWFQSSDLDFI